MHQISTTTGIHDIHHTKTWRSASAVLQIASVWNRLRAFGTDGEEELVKAFSLGFRVQLILSCFIHINHNIKHAYCECGFNASSQMSIMDIFWQADWFCERRRFGQLLQCRGIL